MQKPVEGRKEGKILSEYKHGIATSRKKTGDIQQTICRNMVQVVIGTAPVNTLTDTASAVNRPILLESMEDVKNKIGISNDWEKYTILHSVYASFKKHAVSPIVVINVLDPENSNHIEAVVGAECTFINKRIVVEDTGILKDKVEVSDGETTYEAGTDYVTSFDSSGHLVIAATDDGALKEKTIVSLSYSKLNPDNVTEEDIVGGIDEVGNRSGVELIDDVYPLTGIIPEIIIAPVYSKHPAVAAALEAKAQKIYGMFNGIALVDLDSSSSGADIFAKVPKTKEKNVPASRWVVPLWPMVQSDGYKFAYSAYAGALLQAVTVNNNNIPSESVDNMELLIDGLCTEDGSDIFMIQEDVNNYLNAYGVVGAIKLPTWKAWGNNTAAYPDSEDPMERWIKSVTMLNFLENKFKQDYLPKVGRSVTYKFIEGIVSEFNMALNSYVPDYLAGAEIVFNRADNPKENIMAGYLKFVTRYADYTPAEFIENEFTYDINMLEAALGGEE